MLEAAGVTEPAAPPPPEVIDVSTLTPMMRPGTKRLCFSSQARKPAWGPPKPSGTPKRWLEPIAMSAPSSPGGTRSVRARRSVVIATSAPFSWAVATSARGSTTAPSVAGYASNTPKKPLDQSMLETSPITTSMPSGSGTGTLVRDKKMAEELWNPMYKAWFPKGLDDPQLALLRVDVEEAEYWDAPSSTMVHVVGFVKAILTGKQYAPGEHATVTMNPTSHA